MAIYAVSDSQPWPILQLSPMEVVPAQGIGTTVLNCSSHSSTATNVIWLRNDQVIEEENYHQILRDAVSIVYDNLLMIPGTVIESGWYECIVNDSQTERHNTIRLEVGKYSVTYKKKYYHSIRKINS